MTINQYASIVLQKGSLEYKALLELNKLVTQGFRGINTRIEQLENSFLYFELMKQYGEALILISSFSWSLELAESFSALQRHFWMPKTRLTKMGVFYPIKIG